MAVNARRGQAGKEREDDYEKLDKMTTALSYKSGSSKSNILPYVIEDSAKDLLLDHAHEIVSATIEAASVLAKHRGADSISIIDVQLILAKKHGVDVSGLKKGSIYLHKNSCLASVAGGLEITSKSKGFKRKFKNEDA